MKLLLVHAKKSPNKMTAHPNWWNISRPKNIHYDGSTTYTSLFNNDRYQGANLHTLSIESKTYTKSTQLSVIAYHGEHYTGVGSTAWLGVRPEPKKCDFISLEPCVLHKKISQTTRFCYLQSRPACACPI